MHSKGRKLQYTSLRGIQGNLSNIQGPKAARVIHRTKEKQAQRASSWDANPLPPKEKFGKPIQEGRDQEAEPCMFTGVPV